MPTRILELLCRELTQDADAILSGHTPVARAEQIKTRLAAAAYWLKLYQSAPKPGQDWLALEQLAQSILSSLASLAQSQGKALTCHVAEAMRGPRLGDREALTHLLTPLLSNALLHAPGPVELRVESAAQPGWACWSIADGGPGLPAQVFQELGQPSAAPSTALGLGLITVRRVAEVLRARWSLDGARLLLEVHLPGPESQDATKTLRVGVLDDNATARMLSIRLLRKAGYEVQEFSTPAQLMAALETAGLDVILLDLVLGDEDGLTVARSIRALPGRLGQTPLIAATGHTGKEKRLAMVEAGFAEHLPKPFRFEEMVEKVERLGRAPRPPEGGTPVGPPVGLASSPHRPPEGGTPVDPPVDLVLLRESSMGDAAFEKDLVKAFLAEATPLVARLHSNLSPAALHTLKGLAFTVGARSLAEIAEEQERSPDPTQLGRLQDEFERVSAFLKTACTT